MVAVAFQMCSAFTEFEALVHKIAFTDSVHSLYSTDVKSIMRKWIVKVGIHISYKDNLFYFYFQACT